MYKEALFNPDVNCGYIQSAWHWEESLEYKICVEWIKNLAWALWFNDAGLFIKQNICNWRRIIGGVGTPVCQVRERHA
jgi:hypothetical protein